MAVVGLDLTVFDIAEEVWALQHCAYQIEATLIGVRDLPPLRETIQSLLASDETYIGYRGDGEDELRGAISYKMEREGTYTLCKLMVHPDYVRQGIGRTLVLHFLSQVPPNHYAAVTAEIRNIPAITLYTQLGFVPKTKIQPAPDITMLLLERPPN